MSEFNIDRIKDLYRVHDASKKQKKEQKKSDDREFKEFLEESDKEPEGYQEFLEEEERPPVSASGMLDMLGAGAAPFIHIEPIEEKPPAGKKADPAADGEKEKG